MGKYFVQGKNTILLVDVFAALNLSINILNSWVSPQAPTALKAFGFLYKHL
jgi:hypothetical protein